LRVFKNLSIVGITKIKLPYNNRVVDKVLTVTPIMWKPRQWHTVLLMP